jgi:hypothetical protein
MHYYPVKMTILKENDQELILQYRLYKSKIYLFTQSLLLSQCPLPFCVSSTILCVL